MPTAEYDALEEVILARLETSVRGHGGRARIEDRTDPGSGLRVFEVVPDSDGAASITVEDLAGDHDELWTTVAGFTEAGTSIGSPCCCEPSPRGASGVWTAIAEAESRSRSLRVRAVAAEYAAH